MAYTPPAGDNVDFTFLGGYTPPDGDDVDFYYSTLPVITIQDVSSDKIFDDQLHAGFTTSVIKWSSSVDGPYRVEIGGSGVTTGYLVKSGQTVADIVMKTTITDSNIEAATTFSGTGNYRFNIYVRSSEGVWNPFVD